MLPWGMPSPALTAPQLATPHRVMTGGFLRLSRTTRIERSFFEAHRAAERDQWWAVGTVEETLAHPERGPSLVGVFLERFESALRHHDGLAPWSVDDRAEWKRLWTAYTEALSARQEQPSSEIMARAWAIAAIHAPDEARRLQEQGADPHLPFSGSRQVAVSGWVRVLDAVVDADDRRRRDKKKTRLGLSRTVAFLQDTWEGEWRPGQRERALESLIRLTWSSTQTVPPAPWGAAFRDRLLAEGASPTVELRPEQGEASSVLASWWRTLDGTHSFSSPPDGHDQAVAQEWGEALLAAAHGPMPVVWGLLSALPQPEPIMRALLARGAAPWQTTAPAKPVMRVDRRPMRQAPEPHSAAADMRHAQGWHEHFEMYRTTTLERPFQRVVCWLESWHAASPQPCAAEQKWRKASFEAWFTHVSTCEQAPCYSQSADERAALWKRMGRAWHTLLGSDWVVNMASLSTEKSRLPRAAWAALLAAASPEDLACLFEKGVKSQRTAPGTHVADGQKEWDWKTPDQFVTGAFGLFLATPECRSEALRFLASPASTALRAQAWSALVCAPIGSINPDDALFWHAHLGTPPPDEWPELFDRALRVNPPLALVLLDDRLRPPLDKAAQDWALAWGRSLDGKVAHVSPLGGWDAKSLEPTQRDILLRLKAVGALEGGTPGAALLTHFAARAGSGGTPPETLSDVPSSWVRAVELLVEQSLWDDRGCAVSDPRVSLLASHAHALCLRQELPDVNPPVSTKARLRL